MRHADILVLPHLWKGLPLVLPEAIVTLIKDEELRANLGRETRKRAQHFSSDRMIADYEEIFTSL